MSPAEIKYRLSEIAATNLQDLPDEAVLALLQERKALTEELSQAEAKKKEQEAAERERAAAEAAQQQLEAKQKDLEAQLEAINEAITPDQDDEKLLGLIQERKKIEKELEELTGVAPVADTQEKKSKKEELAPAASEEPEIPEAEEAVEELEEQPVEASEPLATPVSEEESASPAPIEETDTKEESLELSEEKIAIQPDLAYIPNENVSETTGKVSALESAAGEEHIEVDGSLQTTEFQSYLMELKDNLSTLGTFLQALPIEVKRNRAFMLEVAKIDPAYAMHYADKDTLKKDESFNIAIASMNNQRNTGNALSEMLPEMRTGTVVLEGVKNDFRNVRFIRPEMPEYEEIMSIAQKGALEAVRSLKDAHDIKSFLPPILQKDKAFMAKVQNLTL